MDFRAIMQFQYPNIFLGFIKILGQKIFDVKKNFGPIKIFDGKKISGPKKFLRFVPVWGESSIGQIFEMALKVPSQKSTC